MSFEVASRKTEACLYCHKLVPLMDLAQHVQDRHVLQVGKSKVERITALDTVKVLEEGSKIFNNVGQHVDKILADDLIDHVRTVATDWFILGKEPKVDKFWKPKPVKMSVNFEGADWRGVVGTMDDRRKQSEADKKIERSKVTLKKGHHTTGGSLVIPDALQDMVKTAAAAVPVGVEQVTVTHEPAECVYVVKLGKQELKVTYTDLDILPKATLDRMAHEFGQRARATLGMTPKPFTAGGTMNVLTPRTTGGTTTASTTANMSELLAPGLRQTLQQQYGSEPVQYKELAPQIAKAAEEDEGKHEPPGCVGCMSLAQRIDEMEVERNQLPDGNFVKDLQKLRDKLMGIVVKVAEGDADAQAEARRLLDGRDDDD